MGDLMLLEAGYPFAALLEMSLPYRRAALAVLTEKHILVREAAEDATKQMRARMGG